MASWRFGSLAAGLLIPAMASTTLIIASGGHVEHIEDNQWKAATEPLRAARKRRQRWLLVRWLCLVLLCSSVAVAVGLLGG